MSQKRRTKIGGQFAARTISMLRSPSFGVLSLSARRVLDRLEIELADQGMENGRLPVTYDDFHRFGLHRGRESGNGGSRQVENAAPMPLCDGYR